MLSAEPDPSQQPLQLSFSATQESWSTEAIIPEKRVAKHCSSWGPWTQLKLGIVLVSGTPGWTVYGRPGWSRTFGEAKALLSVKRSTPRLTCTMWVRQPCMPMSDLKPTSPEFPTVWFRGEQYAPPWLGCSAFPVSLSTLWRMYGSIPSWDLTCLRNWNLAVVLLFILMKTLPRMAATELQELRQDGVNSANSADNRYISPTR